jgi:hypothetical protein
VTLTSLCEMRQKRATLPPVDWLAAVDNGLCARLQRCTCCGCAAPSFRFDIWTVGALAVSVVLCHPCHAVDSTQAAVSALLDQRYAQAP